MAETPDLYNSKQAVANKFLNPDGEYTTLDDIITQIVPNSTAAESTGTVSEVYQSKPALVNKFMNEDGSYSTLDEILARTIGGGIGQFDVEVVEELPETGEKGVIYLVPNEGSGEDIYDEYIWIPSTNSFEKIGSTAIDLSGYEQTVNKVTSISASSTDTQYPTAKLLYDQLQLKQNNLTAGTNIQINNGTISATDTTYTAGTNVNISSENVISATDTTYTAGANISIDGNNEISATNTTYSAGTNITIDSNNQISATDTTYSAGTNVSISAGNVISATDTTYSNFIGTDGSSTGTAGLVPAPATTDAGKFLKADGTWATVSSGTTYTAGDNIDITNNTISVTGIIPHDETTPITYFYNDRTYDDTGLMLYAQNVATCSTSLGLAGTYEFIVTGKAGSIDMSGDIHDVAIWLIGEDDSGITVEQAGPAGVVYDHKRISVTTTDDYQNITFCFTDTDLISPSVTMVVHTAGVLDDYTKKVDIIPEPQYIAMEFINGRVYDMSGEAHSYQNTAYSVMHVTTPGTYTFKVTGKAQSIMTSELTPIAIWLVGENDSDYIVESYGPSGVDYTDQLVTITVLDSDMDIVFNFTDTDTKTPSLYRVVEGTSLLDPYYVRKEDIFSGTSAGLVPSASAGDTGKFLKSDGTWDTAGGNTIFTYLTENKTFVDNTPPDLADGWYFSSGYSITVNGQTAVNSNWFFYVGTNGTGTRIYSYGNTGQFLENKITYLRSTGIYSVSKINSAPFTGTDGVIDGIAGYVPAPTTSDTNKYLKSDGTWATVSGGGGSSYTAGDYIDITNDVISVKGIVSTGEGGETEVTLTSGKYFDYFSEGGTLTEIADADGKVGYYENTSGASQTVYARVNGTLDIGGDFSPDYMVFATDSSNVVTQTFRGLCEDSDMENIGVKAVLPAGHRLWFNFNYANTTPASAYICKFNEETQITTKHSGQITETNAGSQVEFINDTYSDCYYFTNTTGETKLFYFEVVTETAETRIFTQANISGYVVNSRPYHYNAAFENDNPIVAIFNMAPGDTIYMNAVNTPSETYTPSVKMLSFSSAVLDDYALKSEVPNYTAGDYIDITGNEISVKGIVSTNSKTPLQITTGQYYYTDNSDSDAELITEADSGYYKITNSTNSSKDYIFEFSGAVDGGNDQYVAFTMDANNQRVYDDLYYNPIMLCNDTANVKYFQDICFGVTLQPGSSFVISCQHTDLYTPSAFLYNLPNSEALVSPGECDVIASEGYQIDIRPSQGWNYFVYQNTGEPGVFGFKIKSYCNDSQMLALTDSNDLVYATSTSGIDWVTIPRMVAVYLNSGDKLYVSSYHGGQYTPEVTVYSAETAVLDDYLRKDELGSIVDTTVETSLAEKITYGTTDLTADVSPLDTGTFYFVYR